MGETARSRGFYKSGGEYGFKFLSGHHIAILWIPEGAWVHVEQPSPLLIPISYWSLEPVYTVKLNRWTSEQKYKHRASEARVVKILRITQERMEFNNVTRIGYEWHEVDQFYSVYDHKFVYRVGDTVKPKHPYSAKDEACASGIHYYTTMTKLLLYMTSHGLLDLRDLTVMFGRTGRTYYLYNLYNKRSGGFKIDQSTRFMHDIIEIIQADMEVLKSNGATEIDGIDPLDYFPDSGFVV